MKLPSLFNKPRWQSKDAATRRAGVASDDDAELLAALATIAREDDDAGVRAAAMKRLADPGLTQRLAHEDADAGVRADARALWLDLLAGNHPRSPSAVECARLLRAQEDVALIEHVARSARYTALRASALAHATRPAFLVERASVDADPAIRLAALERIDDEALLERLAERARKTDKAVSRRARERAEALRIGRGDTATAETRARLLCERLERLVREPRAGAEDEIETQWHSVSEHAGDTLRARYAKAKALLATARETPRRVENDDAREVVRDIVEDRSETPSGGVDAAVMPSIASTEQDSGRTLADDASSDDNGASPPLEALGADHVAAVDENVDASARTPSNASESAGAADADTPQRKTRSDRTRDDEATRAAQVRLDAAVAAFAAAVGENAVARAHETHAEIAALRKTHAISPSRNLQRELADAERGYARLREWQQWSDDQRRRALCESVESIAGSGLHPDAIATRVREAQQEWTRLDAAEGHAKEGAQHGLARRFHAACRRAIEPARSYFRARDALRKTHADAITATLAAAQTMPSESTDWPAIAKQRLAIVEALRGLDRVEPAERKSLAKSLKATLTSLDQRLAQRQAEVESAKSALIAEAEALTGDAAPRAVANTARALQQRWRDAGNGRRDRDQAQWKRFRAALDAAFAKLDAERAGREARDAGAREQASALCTELEALASGDDAPSRASVAAIEQAWDALGVRDDAIVRRFRSAQSAIRDAASRRHVATRRVPYSAWLARYRLCRAAERSSGSNDALRAQWDAAPSTPIATEALARRFEAALGGGSGESASDERHRDVLVRIELLAGVESPASDQDSRRKLQVERLASRMRGGASKGPDEELAALLLQWTEIAPCDAALDGRFERAFDAAVATLP
jgi:DNA repair protein SbcC/Rad50